MNKSIPLKTVLVVVAALVVLGGTFYAGMAYENHRISSSFEEAFSGFGEDLGDDSFGADGDGSGGEGAGAVQDAEPVELTENEPVEVTTYDGGTMTITLRDTTLHTGASADDVLTRNLAYVVKIENTGDTPVEPSLSGHYETDAGQVLEFAGVMCTENDLPYGTLQPGQFVQGCGSHDLPDDAGRLVFDEYEPTLYLPVDAAS